MLKLTARQLPRALFRGGKRLRLRKFFQTQSQQYRKFNGRPFWVLKSITKPDEDHDAEVLPLYLICFSEGQTIEAWPEEMLKRSLED
jgi:hypothetical protein